MKIALTFDVERDIPNLLDTVFGVKIGLLRIIKVLDKFDIKGKTILLHSNSASILEIFKISKDKNINILQTIAYPVKEGITQAKDLSENSFLVKIISDSCVTKYIPEIDFALLGADVIFKDYFINKVGSFSVALGCKYYKKPLFVIADPRKLINNISNSSLDLKNLETEEPKDPNELCEICNENMEIENYYFEKIPNKLVTRFITEIN